MTADDLTIAEHLNAAQHYLETRAGERPVEAARGRVLMGTGTPDEVMDALNRYQNDDGGFGHGLEPDISAPQSNPFAARIALQVIAATGIPTDALLVRGLADWLETTQGDNGCWRWAAGVLDHPIAPWFAGWTFPSLNPALDLAGWLARLGLGSTTLHDRCRALYVHLADVNEIATGEHYTVLPYAESVPWITDLPDRDPALTALAERLGQDLRDGADPHHTAELLGPADGPIARRIPADLLATVVPAILAAQQPDGHWDTPYDAIWTPYQTVTSMAILTNYPS